MPQLSVNGVSLYYELNGPTPPDPALGSLVFLSGLTGDHNNWQLQVGSFSSSYRCLTFDWRDTGQSGPSPQPLYGLDDLAADVAALIAATGLGRSHLVGLSMGGAVAQHLALNYPEAVASLTLASTFAVRSQPPELPPGKRTPGNLRHSAALARHDTRAHLPGLNLPVLVLAGSRDTVTPPQEQAEYAALIPNSRFVLIEKAGHLVQVERAGEFNRQLRAFLS